MRKLISIIIPVYNAENSIVRCIHSILHQKGVNFEIIVVDDGSEDGSLKLCQKLELLHKELRVYHTENKGVSHARNFGIEKASGTWIVFVDADDELAEGALLASMETQRKYLCDTVCWNMISITLNGSYPYKNFMVEDNIVRKSQIHDLLKALYHIPSKNFYGTLIRSCWGKMYLLQIILENNIRFIENMSMGEDAAFLFEYFHYCKLVAFLDQPLYKYYELGGSVTKRYKKNFFSIQKKEAYVISKLYKKYGENPEKAFIYFWNISFMTYIENEFKIKQGDFKIVQKANMYLQKDIVKKYMVKNKSENRLSKVKSFLLKHNLTLIVAYIYVWICKRNQFLQIKNRK